MARFSFFKFMDHLGRLWIGLCSNIYHHQWPLSLYQSDKDGKRQFPSFCPQSEVGPYSRLSRWSPSLMQMTSFTEIFKSKELQRHLEIALTVSFLLLPSRTRQFQMIPSPHFVGFPNPLITGIFKSAGKRFITLILAMISSWVWHQKHRQQRQNRCDYINIQSFCTAEETTNERKGHIQNGRTHW